MIKYLLLLTILIPPHITAPTLPGTATQDVKVATWAEGAADTDSFESLSFWIKDDQRAYIRYLRGRDSDDVELTWLGPSSMDGHKGFRTGFPSPDNRNLFIAPDGDSLLVYKRLEDQRLIREAFHWLNDGGQGDSAGYCPICAQNVRQASDWLRRYFCK